MKTDLDLSRVFAALADPTRLAILAMLAQGEMTVMEIAEPFKISQPAVSRHVRVLVEAGLIEQRIDRTRRPCRLRSESMDEIAVWLQSLRVALEANYDRLDQVLERMNGREQE